MTSYLFGSRFDPTKIFEWARDKGLFIFEDEAESFNDSKRFGIIILIIDESILF